MNLVTGQRFHNQTLDLDGNSYRDCQFINCQFRFHGDAPFGFEGNLIEGTFWLHCVGNWHDRHELLTPLRDELARYGYRLENALASYANHGYGEEFHGEWIFHREDKWPTGAKPGDPLEEATAAWPISGLAPRPNADRPSSTVHGLLEPSDNPD